MRSWDALIESWDLFWTTYLAAGSIALLLATIGIWVVARNQIFLGMAVAQASTLGIGVALWLGGLAAGAGWLGSDAALMLCAVAASIATALLTARAAAFGRESPEAIMGWVFLLATSLPSLLLANSPHGLEEIQRVLFSTLLGASERDLGLLAGLVTITAALLLWKRDALLLFAIDPEFAAATGLRERLWNGAVALWLGVCAGVSIRIAGTLYAFACLLLPVLIAKNLSRELRPLVWRAPLVGVVCALAGTAAAHLRDLPPAHTIVALLCALQLVAWVVGRLRGSGGSLNEA